MLFEGKEREETRKVRGGELFWGGVAPSRGIVGALLSRSQSFSVIPSQSRASQSFPVVSRSRRPVVPGSRGLAVLSSRRPVVPLSRSSI